jgi:hypothetical protein
VRSNVEKQSPTRKPECQAKYGARRGLVHGGGTDVSKNM